jgi:hypothetical protein
MIRYTTLRHCPRHFQYRTGLTVGEFDRAAVLIQSDWIAQRVERLGRGNPNRKRTYGGGGKYALPDEVFNQ